MKHEKYIDLMKIFAEFSNLTWMLNYLSRTDDQQNLTDSDKVLAFECINLSKEFLIDVEIYSMLKYQWIVDRKN